MNDMRDYLTDCEQYSLEDIKFNSKCSGCDRPLRWRHSDKWYAECECGYQYDAKPIDQYVVFISEPEEQ